MNWVKHTQFYCHILMYLSTDLPQKQEETKSQILELILTALNSAVQNWSQFTVSITHAKEHVAFIPFNIYIYIYIYVCVCVCVVRCPEVYNTQNVSLKMGKASPTSVLWSCRLGLWVNKDCTHKKLNCLN